MLIPYSPFVKTLRVINSCTTLAHLETAMNFMFIAGKDMELGRYQMLNVHFENKLQQWKDGLRKHHE
jgi:hypothetical protein